MSEYVREEEINIIVEKLLADFNKGKNIDAEDIFNKPDKAEVREIVKNLFKIVFPGYFRQRAFKIYNPGNSLAVTIENISEQPKRHEFLRDKFEETLSDRLDL